MSNYLEGEVIKVITCGSATDPPGTPNPRIRRQDEWGSVNWSLEDDNNDCPHMGFIRYIVVRDRPDWEDYIEMRQVYVLARHRKFGIATRLFKELEKVAREEKIKTIYIKAYFAPHEENAFCLFLRAYGYKQLPQEPSKFDWEKHV